ncbi:uncharacterized protein B0H18DRAFT_1121995 [Fomitopsis serialis]|uniref:uncharacterized protein n=1 Tax=Fomitopsis serialis TaxID=139415 RepID=UPI0020083680|nr:uncharacterized protein B0H18DRAFT_1121995 [Neoantrodia serialis]KAH9920402.1 hypothetical protein B0H18DRAFT_1121995 [Neoantrodia serialis]
MAQALTDIDLSNYDIVLTNQRLDPSSVPTSTQVHLEVLAKVRRLTLDGAAALAVFTTTPSSEFEPFPYNPEPATPHAGGNTARGDGVGVGRDAAEGQRAAAEGATKENDSGVGPQHDDDLGANPASLDGSAVQGTIRLSFQSDEQFWDMMSRRACEYIECSPAKFREAKEVYIVKMATPGSWVITLFVRKEVEGRAVSHLVNPILAHTPL